MIKSHLVWTKWHLDLCNAGNRQTSINSNGSHCRGNQYRDGAPTSAFSTPRHVNVDLHPANVLNRNKTEQHISLEEDDDDDLLQVP